MSFCDIDPCETFWQYGIWRRNIGHFEIWNLYWTKLLGSFGYGSMLEKEYWEVWDMDPLWKKNIVQLGDRDLCWWKKI